MNRLENNIKLIDILKQLAYEFPDMRFNQLLMSINIVTGDDLFYEESDITLNRVRKFLKERQEKGQLNKYIKLD